MKKIVAINASPRKEWNTGTLSIGKCDTLFINTSSQPLDNYYD